MRTAPRAALLPLLQLAVAAVGVGAADLRAMYLERNGKDMRIEIITQNGLSQNGMAEELTLAAGQPIQWRNSLNALEDTNYTLPLDLKVRVETIEGMQARLGKRGRGAIGTPLGAAAALPQAARVHT